VTALDIDERLVGLAREMNRREGVEFNVYAGDITRPDCPGLEEGPFDIILLRDVVEHLEDLDVALRGMASHLAPGGVLFIVFPPYYSPYGAHQQILPRRTIGPVAWNKLPWLQLLPDAMFRRIAAGDTPANDEVMRIRGIRLTLSRFWRDVRDADLTIRHHQLYLSRPTFTLRYGLPVVGAGVLGRIPVFRELFVTAGYFLVSR
jgi:SAM-dependent methyltransferase